MDLAPRSLLVERGLSVDLFAAPHVAELFVEDAWFHKTFWRPQDLRADHYDAVILLSHDRKSLVAKRARLSTLPWVSLQGFYAGPDFHRARFATQRLADLLECELTPAAFAHHSAQKLSVSLSAARKAWQRCAVTGAIAIAVGGVWPERTYRQWPEVIRRLQASGRHRIMLVGDVNGRALADRIISEVSGMDDFDFVGRTDLAEVHALLANTAAVVCADGGLLHLAATGSAPVIALFGAAIKPEWRLPMHLRGAALVSTTIDVDGIAPAAIVEAVTAALDSASTGPA